DTRAAEAAQQLADRTGALIATTLIAKGLLREYDYHAGISGIFSSRSAMQLFEESDCVVAIGASLNERTIEGGFLYPHARIVQIDVLPHIVMGNEQAANVYIQGDAATTTAEITAILARQGVSNIGYHTADVRSRLMGATSDPAEFEIEPDMLDP